MQWDDARRINFHRLRTNAGRGAHQREHDCVNEREKSEKMKDDKGGRGREIRKK